VVWFISASAFLVIQEIDEDNSHARRGGNLPASKFLIIQE
jgi:hypothetical protein